MKCNDMEPMLAAYADGGLSPADRDHVEAHLGLCPACRLALEVQMATRRALSTRAADLSTPTPPWLRTRVAARLAAEAQPAVLPGWRTRLSAFAAAAVIMLAVGAVALPVVTGRSTVVLAAQLALDHIKCFTIEGHAHDATLSVADAEAELQKDYGWTLDVPPSVGTPEGRLVAVRRCLYGDGRAAHLMYRVGREPVSLFILPGLERPGDALSVMGQEEVVWTAGGRTYVLVGSEALRHQLPQMASNLRNEAE